MDEREAKLPAWARNLILELRQRIDYWKDGPAKKIAELQKKNEQLESRNAAMTELLECAAKGGHMTATDIIGIIGGYSLELVKEEE